MNTYLAIITTVLVITQIIRLAQNHIQLRRQNIIFKKQLGDLANMDVQKEDFEIQRKAYRLIVERLGNKEDVKKAHTCETCKYNYPNYDITTKEECGGCCSWNDKWEPKEVKDEQARDRKGY